MILPGEETFFAAETLRPTDTPSTSRILIVDAEPMMRRSLSIVLGGEGRSFDGCGTVAEALTRLGHSRYDLVMLDHRLPDATGLTVLDWMQRNKRAEAVIMISDDDSLETALGAMRRGACDFVRKPYHTEQLRRVFDNALHRRRLELSNISMSQRLQASERMHRYIVESSRDLIYVLTPDGCFSYLNPRIESLLGYQRGELVGKHFSALIHEEDLERVRHAFCERRTGLRAACNVEMRLLHRSAESAAEDDDEDGEGRWITIALNAMGIYARADGPMEERYLGTYGVCRDITERKRAEEIITFQAYHDQLTRLPNRTLFKDRLELALAQAERRHGTLAVMFLDLDSFKLINDTYGHSVGDALLRMVAQRLKQCLRRGDTLARQGGDEFIILLPDLKRAEDAETIAHKIVEALRRPLPLTCGEFRTSVSLGIALYPRDGDSAEVLTKHADIAMYRAKQGGKNNYRLFTPDMNHVYEERMALENDLRAALERDQFELHYQPQVSLSRQAIVGMEALVRWRHPQHGLISPLRFIDVAEEVGLIHEISNWVLETGCRQLAHWHRNGFPGLRLSMNLSGRDFDHPDLVDKVATSLARHALPADCLDLEITESVLLPDTEGVVGQIRRLRELGVGVAVDDFGTGYSSLAYLQNFPISRLKIDRSFVRDLKADGHHPIISAITGIARGFDIEVLAEGVEELQQADVLASLGCDEMQGFYFARPLPPEQATHVLGSFPAHGQSRIH